MEWDKFSVSLSEYEKAVFDLIKMIPEGKYHFVYGVPRGGLLLAVYLSYQLDLSLIVDGKLGGVKPSRVLVVDDCVDTGRTLMKYKNLYDTAVLYYKPWCVVVPTYYVLTTEGWPVFPYEKFDEVPNRERYVGGSK